MERKISVFLAGAWGRKNFGDDMLLLTLRDILCGKGNIGKIYIFGKPGSYLNKLVPEIELVDPWRPYSLDVDLYLFGGGTQFFSFDQNEFQHFRTRLRKILNLLVKEPLFILWKIAEKFTGRNKFRIYSRKRIAVGLGLGPFRSIEEGRKVADELLKNCSYISVRDSTSYRLLTENGRKRQVSLKTDLCYLMDPPRRDKSRIGIKNIAFIVRDWEHGYSRDLAVVIMKASESLRSEGFHIRFVLFRGKSEKNWYRWLPDSDDQPLLWEGKDVDAFLDQLSEFDLVITSRFHGAVMSALSGIPFIAVEIEPKLKLIAEDFPASSGLWKAPFHISELLDAVRQCSDNYTDVLELLKKELGAKKTAAKELKEELLSRIN